MTARDADPQPRRASPARARRRNLLPSLALAAASVLLLLGLLELGVRLFVPNSHWRFEDGTGDWQLDDEIGWVHRANLDVTTETPLGTVRFRTNADGLIPGDATREKAPGTVRIMIFGDSMVVGRSLQPDETYPARLEAILRERGIPADVVNAGVQGHSTDQTLLLMQRWIPAYRPDLVLHGMTRNDLGGIRLATANGQAKPEFRLDEQGRLRLAPPRLAGRIRELGSGFRRWIQFSALYRLIQPGLFLLRARLAGVNERVLIGDFPDVHFRRRAVESFDWALFGALLARMRAVTARQGARFLFYEHPDVREVWPPSIEKIRERFAVPEGIYDPFAIEKRLAAVAKERGVEFLPMVAPFRAAIARGPFHLLPTDPHLNREGHALLAELLADAIETRLANRAPVAGAPVPGAGGRDRAED